MLVATAVVAALLSFVNPVRGGNCWSGMSRGNRCTDLLQEKVSREECCAMGAAMGGAAGTSTAWSDKDMDAGMLFFWRVLGGGVPCQACRDSCAGVSCGAGRRCAIRWGRPQCVCAPDCSRAALTAALGAGLGAGLQRGARGVRGPVCGSDGRSYRSTCRLLKRACRQKNSNLAVAYLGTCQTGSCERVHCGQDRNCVLDQNMSPHCVRCERRCPAPPPSPVRGARVASSKAVCGSDGVTYPSACHLREAACRAGKAIPVSYRGRCQRVASCGAVHCKRHQSCLTDIATGSPRCVTCSYRCPRSGGGGRGAKRRAARRGVRRVASAARVSGSGGGARLRELASLEASPELGGPICGSNNRTYSSWCLMMKDACATGYVIETLHQGACGQAGVEPAAHLNAVLEGSNNAFP